MTICKEEEINSKTYHKLNPFPGKITNRYLLNKQGSTKKTYHVSLDITGSNLSFNPGDTVGIFPSNPTSEVSAIINHLNLSPYCEVFIKKYNQHIDVQTAFTQYLNLAKVSKKLCDYLQITPAPTYDLLQALQLTNRQDFELQELIDLLAPLLPRFYSIASSPLENKNQIDLVVVTFEYEHGGRLYQGLGSSFLCETTTPYESSIPLYVQPNPNFILPDHSNDMIMIGPGTGVAPFRGFMQHRKKSLASGKNWLFFGERNSATDYYYQDFWEDLSNEGILRVNTAFSRDSQTKRYVQHEMLDHARELYNWIQEGANIYICGDAKVMAKDVTETLLIIFQEQGKFSFDQAKEFLRSLRKEKRLLQDVY